MSIWANFSHFQSTKIPLSADLLNFWVPNFGGRKFSRWRIHRTKKKKSFEQRIMVKFSKEVFFWPFLAEKSRFFRPANFLQSVVQKNFFFLKISTRTRKSGFSDKPKDRVLASRTFCGSGLLDL